MATSREHFMWVAATELRSQAICEGLKWQMCHANAGNRRWSGLLRVALAALPARAPPFPEVFVLGIVSTAADLIKRCGDEG